ncbi:MULTISPECIES: hypothetical protein [unclassified Nostoc]|uniref:beta strand repeat-containing protein n=1 Tax=unclassified Nostoc TaxID=2593658 RepID=UPI002AD302AE|nr:hypothetical protein [Nostoc sp. DedQUE03]MDZ7972408.1 hypothetical protein [Nostoc sp. DedQUE03]MDZ8046666.1 hypothetical protein [Nostoc sp. DedQUE02]
MANINGTNGNDTLVGSEESDTINGKAGNDTITSFSGNDTLTGGGGKDQFIYGSIFGTDINITDFSGVGKGVNPSAGVIAEVDTLNFQDFAGFTAQNLLLTQNGNNLEITFDRDAYETTYFGTVKLILQNFALENLDNLSKSTGATVDSGNILFYGQTSITDSFDVFNANSTQSTIFKKNTVTFLNDLSNNVSGFDNSDDVINGQGGDDIIDGKSGNDLLRGDAGNNTLIGGADDDTLNANYLEGDNLLDGGDENDYLLASGDYSEFRGGTKFGNPISGNNTLNGGAGNDSLNANYSTGNNLLDGGAGDDRLNIYYSTGNNLLSGGTGNDYLSVSGLFLGRFGYFSRYYGTGNNTLNGDAGNDTLDASYTTGNNTLNGGIGDDYLNLGNSEGNNLGFGGDGNDLFYVTTSATAPSSLVTQTVDGGKGDDLLSVDYYFPTGGITTTFNATTNIGSITLGTRRVSYKNIERLDITLTGYDDLIVGSNGNDTIDGGNGGNDTIDGGKGDDYLSVNYNNAEGGITTTFNATTNIGSIMVGTERVSYKNIERLNIRGTAYNDNIVGTYGNDTIDRGNGGNDTIDGGKGDDVLSVNYINVSEGITTTFNATTNIGSITAGTQRVSYKNIERLNITDTTYDDNIVGNDSNDTLSTSNGGNDTIDGGKGDDVLSANYYSATGAITSTFDATTNIGSITAGTQQVSYKNIERLNIRGTAYNDLIVGNSGNDTIEGGNDGKDTIIGGAGNDTLRGSDGNKDNTLYGGDGNDYLTGGLGSGYDNLYGGAGIDTFAFGRYNYRGIDHIYYFDTANELIQVSAFNFGGGLSPGSLQTSQFTIGTSASTRVQRFIYNDITGALFFDQDGSASGFTQVQFAQLASGLSLTENNFVVV